jgi:hypothetical protein
MPKTKAPDTDPPSAGAVPARCHHVSDVACRLAEIRPKAQLRLSRGAHCSDA